MTARTLYRVARKWWGLQLDRLTDRKAEIGLPGIALLAYANDAGIPMEWPRVWERVPTNEYPQGEFVVLDVAEYARMQDRIDRAEKRAEAQRRSRRNRNTPGQPQHVLKAEAETPDATDRGQAPTTPARRRYGA